MKAINTKRWLSVLLVLCMAASLFVTPALAAQDVEANPGSGTIPVEYFTSTLYKWDEDGANEATKEADRRTGGVTFGNPTISQIQSGDYYLDEGLTQKVKVEKQTTTSASEYDNASNVTYRMLAEQNGNYMPTDYFYRTGSRNNYQYHPVYVSRETTTEVFWGESYTKYKYDLFYQSGNNYEEIEDNLGGWFQPEDYTTYDLDSQFEDATLYIHAQTTEYYLTSNGVRVEENVTYSAASDQVRTPLYYQSAATGYEGKGFYFTNAGNKPSDASDIPAYSKWDGDTKDNNGTVMQQYSYYSGLAAEKLSESNNAPFSNSVNAASLFATDGSNDSYADVYTNVRVPFVYKDGYYELNSDKNAVYFDGGNAASGARMNIADKPAAFRYDLGEGRYQYNAGFQPFNTLQSRSTENAVLGNEPDGETAEAYLINTPNSPTYGFGMVTTVNFQMTDDGQIDGQDGRREDIIFEFSGDDDVWVYVDGVLALDIGGTHDAIQGTINFATGDVTVRSEKYGKIRDKNENGDGHNNTNGSYTQWNIYKKLGTTLTGFASMGSHTLTVYYMDRGRGLTNCQIRFNLPQRDSVSVTKEISPYYTNTAESQVAIPGDVMETLNRIPFTFTIFKNGKPVSNASYSIMENGQFQDTASTDQDGNFTLLNGQTASFRNISLDKQQSWYVVENTPGERWTGSWSATSSVSGANINGGSGLTSGTVTVTGSATATDTISFVCTNAYAYQSELSVDVTGETSVLDYGLPVVVDVMANDVITGGEFESLTITNDDSLKYGTATVKNGKIEYTLTEEFNGIETVEYQVNATDTNNSTIKASDTGTLTIIPATSVYYEEDFEEMVTYKKSSEATWKSEGPSLNGYQESGLLTDSTCSTYGTDAFYLKQSGHSNGTTMHAYAPAGHAAQFEYDFTGTGTTIYGMINATTGYICVEVTDKTSGENVDYQYIDNVVLQNKHFSSIYNNPFYSITGLTYGKYHVIVYLYPAGTPTSAGTSGPDLYLDGIRVYNPMGTEIKSAEGYDIAAFAYSQDGEANTVVENIRAKLANPIDGAGENPEGGFVTITDQNDNLTTVEEYNTYGPNEELYLKGSTYKLSFAVQNWDSKAYKMYLGIKAPTGTSASVKIGSQTLTIENSTDCYYDISEYIQVKETDNGNFGYVYIEGVRGLVSLTNIKVTGNDKFELVPNKDLPGNPDGDVEGGVDETATRKLVMMSVADANALIGGDVDEPVEDQPVEEAPVFTPGSVKTSCVYSRLLRVATVTVTTSKDVDYVTINGRTVNGVTLFGSRYYTRAFTGISSGETLEIVCYNADGVASQVYTVVAK